MLRANYAMLIMLPALFVGYAACAGEDASEESNGTAEAQLATTAPAMFGTFRDERAAGGIAVLTLKKDWTFHLEEAIECIRAPCIRPEVNGMFKLGTRDGANVLMLMNTATGTEAPRDVEYLKYMLKGDTLYVAPLGRYAVWQALPRSDVAWCEVPYDCNMQNLPEGPCAGRWYCTESNTCNYSCGPLTCDLTNTCPDR